jgi:hypothetical protein
MLHALALLAGLIVWGAHPLAALRLNERDSRRAAPGPPLAVATATVLAASTARQPTPRSPSGSTAVADLHRRANRRAPAAAGWRLTPWHLFRGRDDTADGGCAPRSGSRCSPVSLCGASPAPRRGAGVGRRLLVRGVAVFGGRPRRR